MANQKSKDLLVGAVVGGVLGAVTALLFAPKSGRELRSDIAGQYHQVSEKTQELAGQIAEKSKEVAASVGQKTQDIVRTVGGQTSEWAGKTKEAAVQLGEKVRLWKGAKGEDAPETAAETEAPESAETVQAIESTDIVSGKEGGAPASAAATLEQEDK